MKKKIILALNIALVASLFVAMPIEAGSVNLYEAECERIGNAYGICPELLESMIYFESTGNPKAESHCGAKGLMQIRPELNKERMKRLGVKDLEKPYQNILVGTDILYELSKNYEVYDALVAYNAGEYSTEFERVQNGGRNSYAEKVLELSEQLERVHGK